MKVPFRTTSRQIRSYRTILSAFRWAFLGAVVGLLTNSPAWAATTTNVSVGDNFYSPTTAAISVGDSVKWTWTGGQQHSSTSTTGLWDSGLHLTGFLYTNTFNSTGSFPYRCSNPLHSAQTGSVLVQAANAPPTVTVTSPTNTSVLSAPASLTLAATASDDGSVTNVQFLQGTTSLTNRPASPFSMAVNNLSAGNYTFSAVASDNAGLKATNSVSISVVTPVTVLISSPQRLSATQFRFNYSANAGLRYAVERSASPGNFTALATNIATGSSVTFTDSAATLNQNFYRVGRLPNP